MKKYAFDILNGIVILLGICALAECFEGCENDFILKGVGFYGLFYVLYSGYLLFIHRVKFDWNLLQGNYICKVIALVLLTPFVLALFYQWIESDQTAKALIFEENLYEKAQPIAHSDSPSNLPDDLRDQQKDPSLFWSIYAHYIDPGNQHMSTTPEARIWVAVIAILGVFLVNGLLVSSIIGWIDIRKEKWLKGEVKYNCLLRMRSHYVIIGGNDMVAGIVKQLFNHTKGWKYFWKPYILIQTNRDVESFRRELFTGLTENQQQRIIIYYGSRTSSDDIADLMLKKAKEVYILGEDTRTDDLESYHDTMNMECLRLAYNYLSVRRPYANRIKEIYDLESQVAQMKNELKIIENAENNNNDDTEKKKLLDEKKNSLKDKQEGAKSNAAIFRVMFEYQTTFSVFQFSEISRDIKYCIQFKPFNYYEMWAQKVLINKKLTRDELLQSPYLPLEGVDGIGKNDNSYVHLIVVGMSRMGVSMAIEAAHLAHYPNYAEKNIRTKITFIDKNAKDERNFFMGRFKNLFALSHWRYGTIDKNENLIWISENKDEQISSSYGYLGGNFLDIEWEFVNGGVENPKIQEYIGECVNKEGSIVTIAVCLPEPSRCLAAALYLDRSIYEKVNQVLVYNRYGDSLVVQMTHKSEKQMNPYHNKLKVFGMSTECYDCKMIEEAEFIAKKLNEKYDELYVDIDEGVLLDKSDVAKWWSNIYAANILWTKLRNMKWTDGKEFSEIELETLARTEHARWNMEQLLLGYRPLTETDQAEVLKDLRQKNPYKSKLAHFDICSYEKLKVIDKGSIRYDKGLSQVLPAIYKEINKENNNNR